MERGREKINEGGMRGRVKRECCVILGGRERKKRSEGKISGGKKKERSGVK